MIRIWKWIKETKGQTVKRIEVVRCIRVGWDPTHKHVLVFMYILYIYTIFITYFVSLAFIHTTF